MEYTNEPELKGSARRESVDKESFSVRFGSVIVEALEKGWLERRRIAWVIVGWKMLP